MRQSWDETWMLVARVIGNRSRCVRRRVGCVIVSRDNHVAGVGYNGAPRLMEHHGPTCGEVCDGPVEPCVYVHAEMNALMFSARGERENGVCYVTEMPCESCAKALANSGVWRVVVGDRVDATSAAYRVLVLSRIRVDGHA